MGKIGLVVLLLCSVLSFAQLDKSRPYEIFGIAEHEVYPLMSEGGLPIQWNAPLFEGGLSEGHYDALTKGFKCVNGTADYCYDGQGDWMFTFTGSDFCKTGCRFVATGDLVIGDALTLADGSVVFPLTSLLYDGTYSVDGVVKWQNLSGFYSCYTAPSIGFLGDYPVPGQCGITVVLQPN
jgi:hypothetical protein